MSEKVTESGNDKNTGSDSDQDFDPTADMLVNDFDDEHTLEEEEALEESNSNEIDDLQRESEMPIEELLALYRNMADTAPNVVTSTVNEDNNSKEDETNSESVTTSQLIENKDKIENAASSSNAQEKIEPEDLEPLPVSNNLSRLISTSEDAFYEISDDEEDDDDTQQEDSWRKTIQIGLEYQAAIPDSTVKLNKENIENVDLKNDDYSLNRGLLLWNSKELDELDVENYLKNFIKTELKMDSSTTTNTTLNSDQNLLRQRDNELALYLLLKNNYKIDSALNNRTNLDENYVNLFTFIKPWSEEDCQLFEQGLLLYGKDFYQVQKNKLPNKTVNELVNFYYLWKKTERHDTFTSKFKFEKKRYSLKRSIDLMDHFLDDQQQANQSFNNSTSSSLNNSQNNKHTSSLKLLPQSNHITTNHSTVTMDHNLTTVSSTENDLQTIPTTSNLQNEDNSSDDQSNLVINEINSNDDSLISKKSTSIRTSECSQSTEGSTNLTDVTTSSEL